MKPVFRYDKHMPQTDDVILIVLKGHLLIEEQLVDLANWALPNPQFLPKFMFYNLAKVVRAAVPQRSDDPSWELILKLNQLRNDLAHKLESGQRQATLTELFKIHDQVQPTPGMEIDKSAESSMSEPQRLRIVVQDCMTFLLSLAFEYQNNVTKPKPKFKKQRRQ
jgi:hypothetical protein